VGSASVSKFLERDADAEIFEEIILTLLSNTKDEDSFTYQEVLIWLQDISGIDRFSMMKSFLSKDVVGTVVKRLESCADVDARMTSYIQEKFGISTTT
jgi:hypothetical protein